ncbi:MAG: hypothetical protein ACKOOH_07535 [Cyanobium sp.]
MTGATQTPRSVNLLEYAILVAALLISTVLVFKGSGIVPKPYMDQHFVETVNLQLRREGGSFVFQYPNLMHAGGITSSLIAGVYKLLIPTTPSTLNWHFKIFSMLGYLLSSFALLRTAIQNAAPLRILGFLIIATSGFQLLEPSSDVLSAALLNLFFIGVIRRWPKLLSALILATFGLCKVELTLSAAVLSLLWCVWEWHRGSSRPYLPALLTFLWMALYLTPSFLLTGSSLLESDRSSTAFFSAYAAYMRFHQFQLSPPSEVEANLAIRNTIFRDASGFRDVVMKHPDLYLDFLGVSAARSIPNVVKVFKLMLVPFSLALWNLKHVKSYRYILIGAGLVSACILLPSWLVIFVRMRYIAKVIPLATVATIGASMELSNQRRFFMPLLWVCGVSTILWQLLSLTPYQD